MGDVSVHRYEVPTTRAGEGWAIAFVDSVGCLAVLSDYGDYTYRWPSKGWGSIDFRRFLLGIGTDYLLRKLCGSEREYRGAETLEAIRGEILDRRREARRNPSSRIALTWDEACHEWDLLSEFDLRDRGGFERWCERSGLGEPETREAVGFPRQAVAFAERAWPRIRRAIELDLAFEQQHEATRARAEAGGAR